MLAIVDFLNFVSILLPFLIVVILIFVFAIVIIGQQVRLDNRLLLVLARRLFCACGITRCDSNSLLERFKFLLCLLGFLNILDFLSLAIGVKPSFVAGHSLSLWRSFSIFLPVGDRRLLRGAVREGLLLGLWLVDHIVCKEIKGLVTLVRVLRVLLFF